MLELGRSTNRELLVTAAHPNAAEFINSSGARYLPLYSIERTLRERVFRVLRNRFLSRSATFRFNEIHEFTTQKRYQRITEKYKGSNDPALWRTDIWPKYLGFPFRKSKRMVLLLRWLMSTDLVSSSRGIERYFREFEPALIFICDVQDPIAYTYAYHARKNGVPIIGGISTWDHLTKNGPVVPNADEYWVWNPIMMDEITRYHDVPRSKVRITGAPQFDRYSTPDLGDALVVVEEKLDIPPDARVIVFGANQEFRGWGEPSIIRHIVNRIEAGEFGAEPLCLVIRSHPADEKFDERFSEFSDIPFVRLYRAPNSRRIDPRIFAADGRLLAGLLGRSSLLICGQSTIAIDGATMDIPVINLAFDGTAEVPELLDTRTRYDVDHYQKLIATGGTRKVESFDELDAAIVEYLKTPETDAEGRKTIRQQFAGFLDEGTASQRVVAGLNLMLNTERSKPSTK
jgi:hypothetical protein